jgi:type I restriction enzyme S subunit
MQELFTKGIGHTKFKDSPLGRIPEEWEIKRLGNIGEIKFSNVDKKTHEGQKPVLLCNYMDVYKNEYIHSNMNFMKATASIQEINSFKLKKNDVLFTKDSETPDDIANSSVVIEELENVICGYHLAIVRPNEKIAFGPFLSKQIKSDFVRHQFVIDAKGSTRFGLGLNSISKISIALPSIQEQAQIASILSVADTKIEKANLRLNKLQDLKKGLMRDLLTGKMRVGL